MGESLVAGRHCLINARGWRMDGLMSPDYCKFCGYPPRQAVRYTPAEDRDVLAAYDEGFSVSEIAEYHQRSENGINGRIQELLRRRAQGLPISPPRMVRRPSYWRKP